MSKCTRKEQNQLIWFIKHMKRTLAMILTTLMLSTTLIACSDDAGTTTDTTATPSIADTTVPSETADPTRDENGYLLDSLPAGLNFEGAEIGILNWNSEQPEFEIEEITGDIVNDAIFTRNEQVQKRLNVKLAFTEQKGDNSNRAAFLQFAQKSYQAGEKAYDIVPTYSRTAGMLAINGLCYDMSDLPYLDFEKPWWPQRMLDTQTIGDKLYFISGDASTNLIHLTYGMYYNKDLFEQYQLPDPQQLVLEHKWTQDKLIELTTGIYQDLNGNNTVDEHDRYGFTGIYYGLDAFYTGSELRLIERSDDNLLIISPDFSSEKCINMCDKLGTWANTDDVLLDSADIYQAAFYNGNALICQNRLYMASKYLRDVPFSYGVLPTPLYDEAQEEYISVVGNPYTNYCIMADCEEPETAAAVIEAWGSAAYRLTTPALFENNMKIKYSEDDINAQMFDIIHDTIDFDLGRVFSNDLSYMSEMPSKVIEAGQSWATALKPYSKVLNTQIKKIVDKLSAIE